MCWITVFPDPSTWEYGTWWKNSRSSSGQVSTDSYVSRHGDGNCPANPVPVATARSTPIPSRSAKWYVPQREYSYPSTDGPPWVPGSTMNPTPSGAVYPSYRAHEPSMTSCSTDRIRARSPAPAEANVSAIHSSSTSSAVSVESHASRPNAYRFACASGCPVQNASSPTFDTAATPPAGAPPSPDPPTIDATVRAPSNGNRRYSR